MTTDYIAQYLEECGMRLVHYQPKVVNLPFGGFRQMSIANALWFLDLGRDEPLVRGLLAMFRPGTFTGGQLLVRSGLDVFHRFFQPLPSLAAQPLDLQEPSLYVFKNFLTLSHTVKTAEYPEGVPVVQLPVVEVLYETCDWNLSPDPQ